MIVWILSFTTLYYQEYNNKILLKRMKIENKSKRKLQINLFLIVFVWGIIIIVLSLFYVYIFSLIVSSYINLSGESKNPIIWSNFPFLMYFYVSFYELIIFISLAYFLNHFIKKNQNKFTDSTMNNIEYFREAIIFCQGKYSS